MTGYVCREHPDQPVRPSGSGCPECEGSTPTRRQCRGCGGPVGRRQGRFCTPGCRHRAAAKARQSAQEIQ